MSTEEYTPTTDEVREYVTEGGEPRPWVSPDDESENGQASARGRAFDRWLAQHDRGVAAKALRSVLDLLPTPDQDARSGMIHARGLIAAHIALGGE